MELYTHKHKRKTHTDTQISVIKQEFRFNYNHNHDEPITAYIIFTGKRRQQIMMTPHYSPIAIISSYHSTAGIKQT